MKMCEAQTEQKIDARDIQRMPAYLGGKIIFSQNYCVFDCLIKNISPKGAGITIKSVGNVPDAFKLYVARYDKVFYCKTKWRNNEQLGVSFSEAA